MTWEDALAHIAAGNDPEEVWDSVYLQPQEIAELLEWVKARPVSPWVYPMLVFAAYTGARRSEIVRAKPFEGREVLAEVALEPEDAGAS